MRNFTRGVILLLSCAFSVSGQQQNNVSPAAPAQAVQQPPTFTIVLDPAHGGTDAGARGPNSGTEKDITLQIAKSLRSELGKNGFRVVLTREDDTNPSYDDRAGVANAYRDAIFVSIHVGSTGAANTVRTYWYPAKSALPSPSATAGTGGTQGAASALAQILQGTPANSSGLISWSQAQQPYVRASERVAIAVQSDLAAKFSGSPPDALAVSIRTLRSVALPAIAIEFSNVSSVDAAREQTISVQLGAAISHAVQAYRTSPGNTEAH